MRLLQELCSREHSSASTLFVCVDWDQLSSSWRFLWQPKMFLMHGDVLHIFRAEPLGRLRLIDHCPPGTLVVGGGFPVGDSRGRNILENFVSKILEIFPPR